MRAKLFIVPILNQIFCNLMRVREWSHDHMLVFIFLSSYSSFVSMYFYLLLRRDGWCKVGVSSLHFNANEETIFCDSFLVVRREEKEEEISICKWEPEVSIAKTKLSGGREHMFRRKALYFLSLFLVEGFNDMFIL